jgi:hypothetical protein
MCEIFWTLSAFAEKEATGHLNTLPGLMATRARGYMMCVNIDKRGKDYLFSVPVLIKYLRYCTLEKACFG